MINTPEIFLPSRPSYSMPDIDRLRNTRAWQLYEEGLKYLKRPKQAEEYFNKAIEFAKRLIKKKRDVALFVASMGVELAEWRHYQEQKFAITYCDMALGLDPNCALIWNAKGLALGTFGRSEEAIACFDKALELDPECVPAWSNKGLALGNLERYEKAITCYEKALELDPKCGAAWEGKGWILSKLGKHEEAITCCNKALELDPKMAPTWYIKGWILGSSRRYEEAITCFDKALELDPKYAPAWNGKGWVLTMLGRYKEAERGYREVLRLRPDSSVAHTNLAVLFSVTNKHEKAEKEFKKALKLFGKKGLNGLEKSLMYLEKELEAHGDVYSLWRAKGEFLKALGREAEAKKALERAEFYEAIRYFETNKEELIKKYEGKYVAILHNKVIDSDEDWEALEERIIKRFGSRALLVEKVTKEPEIIYIPTPFLVQ